MTGKAYVAIHHSKALSLSNVRWLFLSIFIKGIRHNLRLKNPAFSKHFPLILLFILKKLWSPSSGLWSGNEWQNTSSLCSEPKIADHTYIISSKENVHRNVEEIGELFPLKRLCTEKHRLPLNRTYKLHRLWYVAEHETNVLQRNLSFGVKMFAKRWAF